MVDVYQPVPGLDCPLCATRLRTWQGKEGPRLCLVFRQGLFDAIGTALDGWPVYRKLYGDPVRLPPVFHIYSYDCRRHGRIRARCASQEGTWMPRRSFRPTTSPRHVDELFGKKASMAGIEALRDPLEVEVVEKALAPKADERLGEIEVPLLPPLPEPRVPAFLQGLAHHLIADRDAKRFVFGEMPTGVEGDDESPTRIDTEENCSDEAEGIPKARASVEGLWKANSRAVTAPPRSGGP